MSLSLTLQDIALVSAGFIGIVVALIHGVLTQRLMVRPVGELLHENENIGTPVERLVPLLLQFSTFNWLIGGLFLIAAAIWFGPEAKLITGLLVGSSYLYGALGNFWGTRRFHPGWILYTFALVLIVYGVSNTVG